ncbi:MAG: hypothetical protein K6G07_03145 [Lachnospiraceae bacterium]|nr:hypothetical protein [Lachnospiraceae bacterium]
MVLKHPIFLYVGIPVLLLLFIGLHIWKRKTKYRKGHRVANTGMLKDTPEFRRYFRVRRVTAIVMETVLAVALIMTLVLLARPSKTETVSNGTKKRDIFLCLDVSYSLYETNLALTEKMQEVVKGLDGDRVGITIFNTSSVLYVPMTDDYDFVIQKLEDLEQYFVLQDEYMKGYDGKYMYEIDENRYYELLEELDYYDAGTLINNTTKGSSLIGEGLSAALYSFPQINDEARTRIIIMSSDNSQEELRRPIVELKEASELCAKHDVTLFGLFPSEAKYYVEASVPYTTARKGFKEAMERTGGKFYEVSDHMTVSDILDNIQNQEAMEVQETTITKVVDQPVVYLIVLSICLVILLMIGIILLL